MNLLSRETAFDALTLLLQSIPEIRTCTRKLLHWQDCPAEEQPSLYLAHTGEIANPVRGLPTRITLEVSLWIYVKTEGEPVGPVLSPILDAVTVALEPSQGEEQVTLGGLVIHCWIEGHTEIFEGNLGDEAVAIVPVKLLIT